MVERGSVILSIDVLTGEIMADGIMREITEQGLHEVTGAERRQTLVRSHTNRRASNCYANYPHELKYKYPPGPTPPTILDENGF